MIITDLPSDFYRYRWTNIKKMFEDKDIDTHKQINVFLYPLIINEINAHNNNIFSIAFQDLKQDYPNVAKTIIKLKNDFKISLTEPIIVNINTGHICDTIDVSGDKKYIVFFPIGYYTQIYLDNNIIQETLKKVFNNIEQQAFSVIGFDDEILPMNIKSSLYESIAE